MVHYWGIEVEGFVYFFVHFTRNGTTITEGRSQGIMEKKGGTLTTAKAVREAMYAPDMRCRWAISQSLFVFRCPEKK